MTPIPPSPPLSHIPIHPNYPQDKVTASLLPPQSQYSTHLPFQYDQEGKLSMHKCIVLGSYYLSKACALTLGCIAVMKTVLYFFTISTPAFLEMTPLRMSFNATLIGAFWYISKKQMHKNKANYVEYITRSLDSHIARGELHAAGQVIHMFDDAYKGHVDHTVKCGLHEKLLTAYIDRNQEKPDLGELRIVVDRISERTLNDREKVLSRIAALFEKVETQECASQATKTNLYNSLNKPSITKQIPIDVCQIILNYLAMPQVSHLILHLADSLHSALVSNYDFGPKMVLKAEIFKQRSLQSKPFTEQTSQTGLCDSFLEQETSYVLRAAHLSFLKQQEDLEIEEAADKNNREQRRSQLIQKTLHRRGAVKNLLEATEATSEDDND